ncbi:MAG: hypothetical protein AAF614_36230 [Chloroflexota bacterium]
MRSLSQLLATPQGRDYLLTNGIYAEPTVFVRKLVAPAAKHLVREIRRHQTISKDSISQPNRLIFGSQQLYVDYRQSVVGKFQAMQQLTEANNIFAFFEWVDTDNARSDKLMSCFEWPAFSQSATVGRGVRVASRKGVNGIESRFVSLKSEQLQLAWQQLVQLCRQAFPKTYAAKLDKIRPFFHTSSPPSLATLNCRLSHFLLQQTIGYVPPGWGSSRLLASGLLAKAIDAFVNQLPAVVRVFNAAVAKLQCADINPQVKPLADDFFPLYYSCESDNRRIKLRHQIIGGSHFAVGACLKCGTVYDFHLGSKQLSAASVTETNRWSPNFCLPVFMNSLVSGHVVGKSSSLYGLVLNAVVREVLGERPLPMFVPTNLTPPANRPDSLLYRYLAQSEA